MKRALLELLADPVHLQPLKLEPEVGEDDVTAGALRASDGAAYPIIAGIPRFVVTGDEGQLQTSDAFGFKWRKRDTYDSPEMGAVLSDWALERYGFSSHEEWVGFFSSRRRILDVGCGGGLSSSFFLNSVHWPGVTTWVGADISRAVDVAHERLAHIPNTHFVQADALQLPFPDGSFDTLFSEGVLHHTPSTKQALLAAARLLEPGGEFHFYVYRRKGPVREFTDDYIRAEIAPLSDEAAWEAMRSLTRLGQALSSLHAIVHLEEDVPLLGISAGEHDVQRLIYWNFAKLYWNDTFSFEENVHVNFDWYRPHYAHRQSAEEVQQWCAEANLSIAWFHELESGFSVRAIKG